MLLGVCGVAIATIVRLPFEPWLEGRAPYALYFVVVAFVGWRGGLAATLVTSLLSLLAAGFFFLRPFHSFALDRDEWPSLLLFLIAAGAIGVVSDRAGRLRLLAQRNEQACRRAERGAKAAAWEFDPRHERFDAVALGDLVGCGGGDISLAELAEQLHPDDRAHVLDALRRLREHASPIALEFRVLHPERGVVWLAVTGEAVPGAAPRLAGLAIDVTAKKVDEQSLREQREWLEVTLRSIGDAVIACDADGRVTFLNPIAERLTGWPLAEARRRPLSEVFTIVDERTRTPADDPAARVLRTGHVVGLANHTALIARDGTQRPIEDRAAPILDDQGRVHGVIVVFHDVSPTRRAALEVAVQREWLQTTLESIADGVATTDTHGRITFLNTVAERLSGHPRTAAIGRPLAEVLQLRDESSGEVLGPDADGVFGVGNTALLRTADGREVPVETRGGAIRDRDGRRIGAVLVLRDVGERRTVERERLATALERERLLTSEQAARAEAERSNRIKDDFLATLSHELRTPLNAILGWVHVLRSAEPDAETLQRALEVVDRNARAQADLIADLLDMSRIVAGKLRLDIEPVDLVPVVVDAIDAIAPRAAAKQLRLVRRVEAVPTVAGDRGRLQQIVANLLSNAVKFTPDGGRVEVALAVRAGEVALTVSDDGRGITKDHLPRIFERFRQADGSLAREFGGLGLGLSIVRQLVEMHGGRISAESEGPGRGALFRVVLPAAGGDPRVQEVQDSVQACERIAEARDERLRGLRVLLVEDDADTREVVDRVLTDCGAEVQHAADAETALQLCRAALPDLLICDIGLPRIDGYELLRRVRVLPVAGAARVPAIALTAFAREKDRRDALRAGYQAHLHKPMDVAELLTTVANFADLSAPDAPDAAGNAAEVRPDADPDPDPVR